MLPFIHLHRYQLLAAGKHIRKCVPPSSRAWSLYGSSAQRHKNHDDKHVEYVDCYQKAMENGAENFSFRTFTATAPLTVREVQKEFAVSPFTAYQIVGDFAHLTSTRLVCVTPTHLGTGAHLGSVEIDWCALRERLNEDSQFRVWFGGKVSLLDLGHLVCEVRQNFKKRFLSEFEAFLTTFHVSADT